MHKYEKEKVESSDVLFPLSSTQGVLVAGGSNTLSASRLVLGRVCLDGDTTAVCFASAAAFRHLRPKSLLTVRMMLLIS